MTTHIKHLSRLTALMVSLIIVLGLTAAGCSDKDRDTAQSDEPFDISYKFAIPSVTATKESASASHVFLTAFDDEGRAVFTCQKTQSIAEHQDVTPEGYDEGIIYEGDALVGSTAAFLVLSYVNPEGDSVAPPDILADVSLTDDASLEFDSADITPDAPDTPEIEVTWNPATTEQSVSVGKTFTVSAQDSDMNALTVQLLSDDEEISIDDNVITGVKATAEGKTADVHAFAQDEAGRIVATMTYDFTVYPGARWGYEETEQMLTLGDTVNVRVWDFQRKELHNITLKSSDPAIVSVSGAEFSCIALTKDPVEVTATVKDGSGKILDVKIYKVTVGEAQLYWNPNEANQKVRLNTNNFIFAHSNNGTNLIVTLDSQSYAVMTDGYTYKGIYITKEGKPAEVIATATTQTGIDLGTKTFYITVFF